MKGDFTRSTFDASKGYSSVRMQQGRVQLDADWNEQLDIQRHHDRALMRDLVGGQGVPQDLPDSFRFSIQGEQVVVNGGRLWADGVLCDTDSQPAMDPLPSTQGLHLAYLDVWQRHVTAVEDPSIREAALGGADTATRTQTAFRVRFRQEILGNTAADYVDWQNPDNTTGQLSARFRPGGVTSSDPCELPQDAGYTGLENHLYRVEVHGGGRILPDGTPEAGNEPTFKWSRDNGSVVAPWLASNGRQVTIPHTGQDSVRGFHDAPFFIELTDDAEEIAGAAGRLAEVTDRGESPSGETVLHLASTEADARDPDPALHPKVRRWDSGPTALTGGAWLDLEHGVQAHFAEGVYRSGDYWLIPARTFIGSFGGDVEWPRDSQGEAIPQPNHGPERQSVPLSLFFIINDVPGYNGLDPNALDCRRHLVRGTEQARAVIAGGDAQMGMPGQRLTHPLIVAVQRGRYPVEGARIYLRIPTGSGGTLTAGPQSGAVLDMRTSTNGTVAFNWDLPAVLPASGLTVIAELRDENNQVIGSPLTFTATMAEAQRIAYQADPACEYLAGAPDVKSALDQLCAGVEGQRYIDFLNFDIFSGDGATTSYVLPFEPKYLFFFGVSSVLAQSTTQGTLTEGFADFAGGEIQQRCTGLSRVLRSANTDPPQYLFFDDGRRSTERIGTAYFSYRGTTDQSVSVDSVEGEVVTLRLHRDAGHSFPTFRGYLYFFG